MTDIDKYHLLNSEIGRLQAEARDAERLLSDSLSRYDAAGQAQANRDLARLENHIVQLEAQKDSWEQAIQQQQPPMKSSIRCRT